MTPYPSRVRLDLQSHPSCVTLVRGMLSGLGEAFELDAELVDDLKTAVSEACNNVVLHAYPAPPGPLSVAIDIDQSGLQVAVCDRGEGIHQVAATEDRMGLGLAVISALADRAEFQSAPDGGTEVRMSFGPRDGAIKLLETAGEDVVPLSINGDVNLRVAPPLLLGGVLGRVARAVAATANFSLDRFSDLYLITDEIAAQARTAATGAEISFALSAERGRLELRVGPLRPGTSARLSEARGSERFPLAKLVNELSGEPHDEVEVLRIVVADGREGAA